MNSEERFVHEPLLQDGANSQQVSEVMGAMIGAVLPHMSPLFDLQILVDTVKFVLSGKRPG